MENIEENLNFSNTNINTLLSIINLSKLIYNIY
jgi:hypothetical protein